MDHNVECHLKGCEIRKKSKKFIKSTWYFNVLPSLNKSEMTSIVRGIWCQISISCWQNNNGRHENKKILSWLTFHFKGLIINLAVSQPTNHRYEHFRQMSVSGNPSLTDGLFDCWWKIISEPVNLQGLGTISLLRLHFWESVWFLRWGHLLYFWPKCKKNKRRDVSDRCY